jgi:hypothetical protein
VQSSSLEQDVPVANVPPLAVPPLPPLVPPEPPLTDPPDPPVAPASGLEVPLVSSELPHATDPTTARKRRSDRGMYTLRQISRKTASSRFAFYVRGAFASSAFFVDAPKADVCLGPLSRVKTLHDVERRSLALFVDDLRRRVWRHYY